MVHDRLRMQAIVITGGSESFGPTEWKIETIRLPAPSRRNLVGASCGQQNLAPNPDPVLLPHIT